MKFPVDAPKSNGAIGIRDIEYARTGIERIDGNAVRVAGASTGQCERSR